jgi:hypothetical protein
VDRRGTSAQNARKGNSLGISSTPLPGPCPLCKGNQLEVEVPPSPDGRQGATSYGLVGPSLLSMLHFLASMLKSLGVDKMAEKQKVILLLDNGAHFSVLPFSPSPRSNDKSYCLGKFWPAPRVLVYPASGLLLGTPPLLSFFPHSSWNSSDSAGMGFTISTKSSNSPPPPPRQLSLLSLPSGTNRSHSVDWWDNCRASQDGPPYSNKTQRSLTVPTPKNNIPSSLRDDKALCLS